MTDSRAEGTLQALWQSQSSDKPAMSLEQVRDKARQLERRVARRNRREYIAAVVAVFSYGWILASARWRCSYRRRADHRGDDPHLLPAAREWIRPSLQADVGIKNSLEFYRVQLERQRDLLRSVWLWFLLLFSARIRRGADRAGSRIALPHLAHRRIRRSAGDARCWPARVEPPRGGIASSQPSIA